MKMKWSERSVNLNELSNNIEVVVMQSTYAEKKEIAR